MEHPDTVKLDIEQYTAVWELYRNHPTVSSCMQAIANFVFGGGIIFNDESESCPIRDRMYHRAAYSALEWLVTV